MGSRGEPPLSARDLAERWQISEEAVARRVRRWKIPAFNVGTEGEPDWRWRLATIEAWEANAERDIEAAAPEKPAEGPKPGAPPTWDGKHRVKSMTGPGKPAGKRKAGG